VGQHLRTLSRRPCSLTVYQSHLRLSSHKEPISTTQEGSSGRRAIPTLLVRHPNRLRGVSTQKVARSGTADANPMAFCLSPRCFSSIMQAASLNPVTDPRWILVPWAKDRHT
jgi:hypothetical protein